MKLLKKAKGSEIFRRGLGLNRLYRNDLVLYFCTAVHRLFLNHGLDVATSLQRPLSEA